MVELGVLADALSACKNCGFPLQLNSCIGIFTYGLASILKIVCNNTVCQTVNNVPTGKKHQRVWDANSKLATGKQKKR